MGFFNHQEILPDLSDFALKEQIESNLMVSISRAWYNGSYTMPAKPIKSVELRLFKGQTEYLSSNSEDRKVLSLKCLMYH